MFIQIPTELLMIEENIGAKNMKEEETGERGKSLQENVLEIIEVIKYNTESKKRGKRETPRRKRKRKRIVSGQNYQQTENKQKGTEDNTAEDTKSPSEVPTIIKPCDRARNYN